jgi:hypothetical protein
MRIPRFATIGLRLVFAAATLAAGTACDAAGAARIEFNRDIRPVLSENCFACHGPDRAQRKANLRLDQRASVLEIGAIVPGHPEKSALVTRINAAQPALHMPPANSHRSLTPAQRKLLAQWIKEGAEYQAHWAYILPTRAAPPAVKRWSAHVRNPIDAFILARLEAAGISPSAEADRPALLRRLSLDVIGLPPTPEQVRQFVEDRSPNAYETQVDRLLASPHYGERMAVPWLDLVRYADTVGFHGDQNMNAWPYRDYVVDSFNKNKPFDQFTIEQLAGDLLPNPTPEDLIATCQNRLNMVTREGGAQPKEYLAKYAADRVRTVSMTWLGSTMACCECHDHKYDPFKTRDFYSMEAFFSDVKQWGVYADYGYTPNPELRGVGNDHPFPPEIRVASHYLQQRIARDEEKMRAVAADTSRLLAEPKAKAAYDGWRQLASQFLKAHADGWQTADGAVLTADKAALAPQPDGSWAVAAGAPTALAMELHPDTPWIAALRLDLLPSAGAGGAIVRAPDKPGTLVLKAAVVHAAGGAATPVAFRYAGANFYQARYSNGFEVRGIQSGWHLDPDHLREPNVSVWQPAAPIHLAAGDRLQLTLSGAAPTALCVAVSPFAPADPDRPAIPSGLAAAIQNAADAKSQRAALLAYLQSTGWDAAAYAALRPEEAEIVQAHEGTTPVMVTVSTTPALTRVLPRGNWQDESGDVVEPAIPVFLTKTPDGRDDPAAPVSSRLGRRLTRLDLAKWIVAPDNPLTARVFVDRLWKQMFGTGLSDQVEDFGTQGEIPTHPKLLDWLATEFRQSGWDVKHMVKLLVMSSTYRQSSRPRPELKSIDPTNRLLASQNPRRLDAEFIRDNALSIAGLLNEDIGGPPCKPYQPAGYYANIQFPDRDYVPDRDDRQWRRGLYTHWQRTFLHPMLANFGAPSREDCTALRTVTNTPQQALTLLNDPEFVEASRKFAERLMSTTGDSARLERAYGIALCRAPKPAEKQSMLAFLDAMRRAYRQRPEDAKKLQTIGFSPADTVHDPIEMAAWTSVCRVILNLHETITRY